MEVDGLEGKDGDSPPPPKPRKPTAFRVQQHSDEEISEDDADTKPPEKPLKPKKNHLLSTRLNLGWLSFTGKRTDRKEISAFAGPTGGFEGLTVPFAREEETEGEKYIAYVIQLNRRTGDVTEQSHRFSDFVAFHKQWRKEYPGVHIDLPKKLLSTTDEDISRLCIELQTYLRQMLDIGALVYFVASFIGCTEGELKSELHGGSSPLEYSESMTVKEPLSPTNKVVRPKLKVAVDGLVEEVHSPKPLPPVPTEPDEPVHENVASPPSNLPRNDDQPPAPQLSKEQSSHAEKPSEHAVAQKTLEKEAPTTKQITKVVTSNSSKAVPSSFSGFKSSTASGYNSNKVVSPTKQIMTTEKSLASTAVPKSIASAPRNPGDATIAASPTKPVMGGLSVKERMAMFEKKT